MRKVFLIFLFFQAIFLASQSDLPEVYTVKIEDTGNDISFYLDQAVLEAIVRATGNFEETRNSKKIMDLDLNSYVREYKFLQEQNKNFIEIKYFNKNKGEITLFFNKKNYNLNGWRLVDINNNITLLKIENLIKNSDIKKNFFLIPEENQ